MMRAVCSILYFYIATGGFTIAKGYRRGSIGVVSRETANNVVRALVPVSEEEKTRTILLAVSLLTSYDYLILARL